ncbi:MAG: HNH endonuclease [Magnetococcales bacterium]|nr:HNH endonuclease [Magnetococcales bacterium]|tara:strand:+ start:6457 stop:7053 length:597 start_codon:yes stop_codon:yes gene_type:complete
MENPPVLVLNADYRPLSWYPLSVCTWQDAIKAMFLGRVNVLESYDLEVNSPSVSLAVPCVIVLKRFVSPPTHPPFTRRNLLLRDMFTCQYCGEAGLNQGQKLGANLTLDHVYPKSKGGPKSWQNMVAACASCNTKKADRTPKEAGMMLNFTPYQPTMRELWKNSLKLLLGRQIPDAWKTYLMPNEWQELSQLGEEDFV